MNLRITTFFFALLLTTLWVFGLMIAHKKAQGDQSVILPSLSAADVKIDKVLLKRQDKDKFEAELVSKGGRWFLTVGKEKTRVDGFRVDNLIKQIKNAKNDETADLDKDPATYGLDSPRLIVTLEGTFKGEDKKWKFSVGSERSGDAYVMVNERPDKVFAVPRESLNALFVKSPEMLRPKHVFEFLDSSVTKIDITKQGSQLELKRSPTDQLAWNFVKPPLGPAGLESEPEETPKKKNPFDKAPPPRSVTSGVKGLLDKIKHIQVDSDEDLEPLGVKSFDHYGVATDKAATMRIVIGAEPDEILYVGKKAPRSVNHKDDYYYARLENDDGVMQISQRWLEPIFEAVKKPGELRSKDVANFDKKLVDAIFLKQGKDEFKFFKSDEIPKVVPPFPKMPESWTMYVLGANDKTVEKKKANENMVNALLEQVLGRKGIVEFHDGTEVELKKKEAAWGLDTPAAEISIYQNAVDKDKKDDAKKEEKKEEAKKDDKGKKDETKKDDKDKDKKVEAKKDAKSEPVPALKKDAKAEVTLAIGKIVDNEVNIRRTLKDGTKTYFTMKKEFVEKILPAEGVELAYLDLSAPEFNLDEVVSVKLQRTTDKGSETLDLVRRDVDGKLLWFIKDSPTEYKLAEAAKAEALVMALAHLPVKKWVKKYDEKLDGDKMKNPAVKATITTKKMTANFAAGVVGAFGLPQSPLHALSSVFLLNAAEKTEVVTIELGKPTTDEKDKPGIYATHSGTKLLFLVPSNELRFFRETDFRDRTAMLYAPARMTLLCAATAAAFDPLGRWMLASPYFTGTIQDLDPAKVAKVRLTIRTPFEVRNFSFERKEVPQEKAKDDKEKKNEPKWTWIDKSGLEEFQVDPDKVAQLVKDFAKLKTDRFISYAAGPRAEHKLDPKDASVKLDLVMEDGKTVTVLIGGSYQAYGHYATSSLWTAPDGKLTTVFFLPDSLVEPILRGTSYFSKDRSGPD